MYKKTIYILLALLLVTAGCGPSTTQSATPSAEPVTTEPPVIVPTDTPTSTPTPRPVGWMTLDMAHSPVPRTGHAMIMLPDGRVLLFGGEDLDGNALNDTWIFDPGAGAQSSAGGRHGLMRPILRPLSADWSPITPPDSPSARQGHSMVTLPDGRVLLFGGTDNQGTWFNDLYVFEPEKWYPIIPANDPPPGRAWHSAWVWNERMYVQGGLGMTDEYLWRYDLQNNTWKQLPNPPNFISLHASPVIYDNKAYFLDQHRCSPAACTVNFYDMLKDTWESTEFVEKWPVVGAYYMTVQVGTQAYLMGGANWDQNTQTSIPIAEVWRMDLETLTWTRLEDMPHPGYMGKAVYDPYRNSIITYGGMILLDGEEKYSSDTSVWWLRP